MPVCRMIKNMGNIMHLNHEAAAVGFYAIACAETGEKTVDHPDASERCWDMAAQLSKNNNQGHLQEQCVSEAFQSMLRTMMAAGVMSGVL